MRFYLRVGSGDPILGAGFGLSSSLFWWGQFLEGTFQALAHSLEVEAWLNRLRLERSLNIRIRPAFSSLRLCSIPWSTMTPSFASTNEPFVAAITLIMFLTDSGLISVGFILEFLNYSNESGGIDLLPLTSSAVHHIVYCLLQIGYISALTLPQAILLWTEPDMEAEG